MILDLYGSPDARQINGIGGADPLTSKVAIVNPSDRDDADIDYTFGYVGIADAVVDYEGNCGNISAGAGVFAIMEGFVKAVEPETVFVSLTQIQIRLLKHMCQSEMVNQLLTVILLSMVYLYRCSYYIIFLGAWRF